MRRVASRRISLILLGLALCFGGVLGMLAWERTAHAPGPLAAEVNFEVRSGESGREVLRRLEDVGALRSATLAYWWWRVRAGDLEIRAGRYRLVEGASVAALLDQLQRGRVILESLTIIEGSTFADFRDALQRHPHVRQTLTGLSDTEVMAALALEGHPEGRFFPDTYRFAAGTTDRDILRLGHAKMHRQLMASWETRDENLPLRSPEEVLILASIVEKETGLSSERARVAGVFISRLRRGMRLQSDPTIIYGLGERFDGDIRTRDLRTDTPYNTYTRGGLPPTPISLPGAEALRAVVRPDETGDLFFVATGKDDGSHRFSRTYAEHREAVRAMLERQRAARRNVKTTQTIATDPESL
jgi:UPF0755 protein